VIRPRRVGLLLAAFVCVSVAAATAFAPALSAQDTTRHAPDTASSTLPSEQDYSSKRQATMSDIKAAQHKLAELRTERIELESRVDSVAVKATQKRASELLLSHETTALRSLDSMLTASQEILLAQRDRFLSLGEAVRRRADAELVVVVRVDSGTGTQHVEGLTVQVDSAPAAERRYSNAANDALSAGAVDEVYHSNVLPSTHAVTLTMSLNGSSQTKAVSVDVPTGAITYVQFTVHAGQLVLSTWINRSGPQ
jgi:hypothetical protein